MNLALSSEIEKFIETQVESGKYSSAEEVILAGIRLLEERERIYQGRFEELKREITIGVEASERGEVVDGETVFSQLQQKRQQRFGSDRDRIFIADDFDEPLDDFHAIGRSSDGFKIRRTMNKTRLLGGLFSSVIF
jgi:antitoxin ParD1/3/4